ncbi:MAG: hypothetical protein IKJ13_04895 [Clostridia bacterium]|nr:hypothetical protein [Clostridia bacterium]
MARSQFFDLINGYEAPMGEDGKPLPLGKRFYSRSLSGSATGRSKRRAASRIAEVFALISKLFTYTKAKVYGLASLTFGLAVLAVHFLGYYVGLFESISTATLVISAVFCIVGIPLLFIDKPLSIMLQDAPFFDFIFFEFFCIQRVYRKEGEASIHPVAALFAGLFGAVLSCFIPTEWIALVLGALLFVCVAFGSPEFSYVASILFLPFSGVLQGGYDVFCIIILLTAVSFLRKVYQGKRVIYFEKYDFLILVMIFCMLVSGIFIKGMESFAASAIFVIMSLGYFVTSNIITNRRLADRAMNAVVVSSVPVSIMAVVSFVAGIADRGEMVFPCEKAVFDSTDILATFLIVAICFSAAHSMQTHAIYKKLVYAVIFMLDLTALLLTGEIFALAALILGGASYFAFKLKRPFPVIVLILLFLLPLGFYFLPEKLISPLFKLVPSVAGYKEAVEVLFASFKLIGSHLFFGVGMGSESVATEMLTQGIIAENTGNLYLELVLEAGIFSLIAFVILMVTKIGHRMSYSLYIRSSVLRISYPIVAMASLALLFYGFFSYIWADASMFYLFFLVFGIESAMLRVSRRDNDERILYYVDARSVDSAAIDVDLEEE